MTTSQQRCWRNGQDHLECRLPSPGFRGTSGANWAGRHEQHGQCAQWQNPREFWQDKIFGGFRPDRIRAGFESDRACGGKHEDAEVVLDAAHDDSRLAAPVGTSDFIPVVDEQDASAIDASIEKNADERFAVAGSNAAPSTIWFGDVGRAVCLHADRNGDLNEVRFRWLAACAVLDWAPLTAAQDVAP